MSTLEERKAEYLNHETAGKDFYNGYRCQLTLDIENGTKTLRQATSIHIKLKDVGEYLITGDWKSALISLESVTANENCTQADIDSMKLSISDYITTNYNW